MGKDEAYCMTAKFLNVHQEKDWKRNEKEQRKRDEVEVKTKQERGIGGIIAFYFLFLFSVVS